MLRSQTATLSDIIKDEDAEKDVMVVGLDVDSYRWTFVATEGHSVTNAKRVRPGDLEQLEERIEWAADQLGIEGRYQVVCCYEAGREGFWIYRKLWGEDIPCEVLDPGSLPEPKKGRRAKTDKTDAERMAREFRRHLEGLDARLGVVNVPDPDDEDIREWFREQKDLKSQRNTYRNKIRDLLAKHGITEYRAPTEPDFGKWLEHAETGWGEPLGEATRSRLERTAERLRLVEKQLDELEAQRDAYLSGQGDDEIIEKVRRATMFRGVGVMTAWGLVVEMFGWRDFNNRRELGAYVGIDGKRHDSGGDDNDRGITRQGNRRVRALAIQLARNWLQWQADSELSQWARSKFGRDDGTVTHTGVVALARKLLNRLRIFVHGGEAPRGAKIRAAKI